MTSYLTDFAYFERAETAGCEGKITDELIWEILRHAGAHYTLGIDTMCT